MAVATNPEDNQLDILINDVFWTEKCHFVMVGIWRGIRLAIGLIATVASALATGAIVAESSPTVAGIAALVATISAGLLTFLKPEESAQRHLAAGRKLGALRVEMRLLREMELPAANDMDAIREAIKGLAAKKAQIDSDAPHTSDFAVIVVERRQAKNKFGPPTS